MKVHFLMMFIICGTIWGGFIGLLWHAVKREGAKQRSAAEDA